MERHEKKSILYSSLWGVYWCNGPSISMVTNPIVFYCALHHSPTLDTRHPFYRRYLLQTFAAVRNLQTPTAGLCCSEKKLDTRYVAGI